MIYETTIQFTKIDANGNDRVVKQKFIVLEADTHGDAEEQTYKECQGLTGLDIIAVKRSKIKEVVNKRTSEYEKVFMADVVDVQIDDDGEEKELAYKMALFAPNIDTAHSYMKEWLKQGYDGMELCGLKCTKFVDAI